MSKKLLPTIITLANLILGITSLWYTMAGTYREAALAILFAMVLDGLDGRIARHFQVSSDFGKELDSLSDLVSFGVAPALLTYGVALSSLGTPGLMVAIVFALCGAIRLARFNVLNIMDYFIGVPITFAGSLMALLALLAPAPPLFLYPVAMLVLSYLMVSNIKVRKY
ncbi:MAG: CDP-diacylglycerol--serine O-phosphatidyltransferase [Clostridia bacterium]|jgi:CDP-diacylglycerol--serine O-phosphatidyltransferase|nr:CDP-diacylglycerol--serine O-phosphatidyltransferase [Clostridia bacterium]